MLQLSEMLETTREAQAREAFAPRYARDALDVDNGSGTSGERSSSGDNPMGAYLGALRRAAGLEE